MRILMAFALGFMGAQYLKPDEANLRLALEDFIKTNRELRATSAQLRLVCEPWPKVRPATQAGA